MRRVFKGGALVALIAILIAPAIYADDPPSPTDPPQARLGPPGGIAAEARLGPPTGGAAQGVRIRPPIGTQGRIGPPIGADARIGIPPGVAAQEPTVFELFWAWLQARMIPPIG